MKFSFKKGVKIWIAVLVSVSVVLAFTAKDIYRTISDSYNLYSAVFRQILLNYADPLDAAALTESNIKNMTRELDPYTVYMTEEEKEPLEILSKGEYGGVGLRISLRNDTLTVISPIEGSPAKKANILPGDQILKVDTIWTTGLDLDKATRLIRGNIGTKVELLIRRPGGDEGKVYILERAKIQVYDVYYADYLEEGIGYIRLAEFSKGSTAEVRQAIENLKNRDRLEALILDLRSNPGGLLEEALAIAELFTQLGDTLLFTRGQNASSNRVFIARSRPLLDESIKIAVLIDGGSASASEIVAGIVQDLDRGIILGTPSFGKGLVQTVFRVDKEHSIKLTTAKYYIPSGRLIQKPDYIKNPKLVVSSTPQDSIFYSRHKRQLKSNGGITPDVIIKADEPSDFVTELWRQNQFYSFAIKYKTEHNKLPDDVDGPIIKEFKNYIDHSGFKYVEKTEKNIREIEKMITQDERLKNVKINLQPVYEVFDSLKAAEFENNRLMIQRGIENQFAILRDGIAGQLKADLKYDKVVSEAISAVKDDGKYRVKLGLAR